MSNKRHKNENDRNRPLDLKELKESTSTSQKKMNILCKAYWESTPYILDLTKNQELEIKFATSDDSPSITRNDYDNVIQQLLALGFTSVNMSGEYLLRISNEYLDPGKGKYAMSNIRTEIKGFAAIQQYCQNNDILSLIDSTTYGGSISMQKKEDASHSGTRLESVTFKDFDFRVAYKVEENYNLINRFGIAKGIIDSWVKSKKTFRYINRVTFTHPDYPVNIDISIVKSSRKRGRYMERTYTTSEANVFNTNEDYEMEVEIDNSRIGPGTDYNTIEIIVEKLKKCAKFIMMGLQETNYPIALNEYYNITAEYLKLTKAPEYVKKFNNKSFIGPNSFTLQLNNISENEDNNLTVPNIRKDYTVTDKADGERRLMYVSKNGMIYLFNTNMKILFTGSKTTNEIYFNSLLDGEIISHDKKGNYINLFAAFDIYIINKLDVRANKFYLHPDKEEDTNKSRLFLLGKFMRELNVVSISSENSKSPLRISVKQFYATSETDSIFTGCSKILKNEEEGLFEYNTDGLIFTPSLLGVGSNKIGEAGPLMKTTWKYSFKWKPSYFNTIDFLVTTEKDDDSKDIKHTIFDQGVNNATAVQYSQYKTLVLRCGFDETVHGYVNPCQNVIDDELPEYQEKSLEKGKPQNTYGPQRFYPTDPYDENAGLCNIILRTDSNGNDTMYSEEHEVIEDKTIVEFRYDHSREAGWRWIPLRVRYDKTTEFRLGLPNFGNDYKVANSNWHSIHKPITEEMITTGRNIPQDNRDDGVYYNRGEKMKSDTHGLRDFHNLYVKMSLIKNVARPGDTLIDFACGKGGDLSKWSDAKLAFIYGVDLSPDNIENRMDGACARYLSYRKSHKFVPGALFVNGNSEYNIRSGQAILNEKAKQINASIFGNKPKDNKLGKGVSKHHGIGEDGFNISSCQFALHYFFKDKHILHRFLTNIAECTKIGGYFIGACYDGKKIFNMLKHNEENESTEIFYKNKRIWGVTKMYPEDTFNDDNTSLGYTIEVFQETINKPFKEFLVNFDYFIREMENYGFQILQDQDANDLGFPSGSGLFEELYNDMNKKILAHPKSKQSYGMSTNMKDIEKEISFKNRYFIFKKVSNVNIDRIVAEEREKDTMTSLIERKHMKEEESNTEDIDIKKTPTFSDAPSEGKKKKTITVRKPRKLNKSIMLEESSK